MFGPNNPQNFVPTDHTGYTVSSLTLTDASGNPNAQPYAYTLDGSGMTVGSGGIADNSVAAQTIAEPLTLSADQTWATTYGRGQLTVSGPIDTNGQKLTLATGGTFDASAYLIAGNGAAGTLNLNGPGTVNATRLYAGANGGTGTIFQTEGTVNVGANSDGLTLGDDQSGRGNYNLSGGTLNVATAYVGRYGTGTVTQTGGTFNAAGGSITVGSASGSVGTYNLSAGSVAAADLYAGSAGAGTVAHSGGTVTLSDDLVVGSSPTVTGTYNLSGTGTVLSSAADVGLGGRGTLGQTGGTLNLSNGTLTIGRSAGGVGTYNLSAGTVDAGYAYVGDGGDTSSGVLNVSRTGEFRVLQLNLGNYGVGTVNQSGGTVAVTTLLVADAGGGASTYNLSGGTLTTANTVLNNDGLKATFNQTGGTNTTTSPYFGSAFSYSTDAVYRLSGSGILRTETIACGAATAVGSFQFDGGTLQVTNNSNPLMAVPQAEVLAGGAVIDTQAYNVTLGQPLTTGATAGTPRRWAG